MSSWKKKGRKGNQFICTDLFAEWYVAEHNRNNSYNKFSLDYLKSLPNYKKGITKMMIAENERRKLVYAENAKIMNTASHEEISCPICGTTGSTTNIKRSHFEKCTYPIIKKNIEVCLPEEDEFSIEELIDNLNKKTKISRSNIKRNLKSFFLVKGGKSPAKGSSSNISYQKWKYEPKSMVI